MSLLSRRSGAQPSPAANGYSLLDGQLTITGDIDTAGSLRIDGKVFGNIRRADTVVLGVGATMVGNVNCREMIIGGALTGNITASERVELQPTAIVTGDIFTQVVLVQEGGVVNGRVEMQAAEATHGVASPTTDSRNGSLVPAPR
jgi:cytoskeletal protein CcmA (bactofilin family)